ncbi:MAG: hypothetical protein HZB31_15365 [Nitrospirae bacterium]|nr:hypothetical protein [Nitrospirota bacterium]
MQVLTVVQSLKVTDALCGGEILHAHGLYATVQSGRVNFQKQANKLSDLGTIERKDGFYRTLDCRSEFGEHARLLTRALTNLLKLPKVHSHIHREISISEIGLRPDAICLITKDNQGLCLILEVCNNETEQYLQQKVNTWKHWDRSLEFLSDLFHFKIPQFHIAVAGDTLIEGTIPFKSILEEIS